MERATAQLSPISAYAVTAFIYEPDRHAVQSRAAACFEQRGRMMRWGARIYGVPGLKCASGGESHRTRRSKWHLANEYQPGQVVNLLRQIEVAIANGKVANLSLGSLT